MNELDDALDQYDVLWRESLQPPQLDDFLQQSSLHAHARSAALPELIAIDMEYRWRSDAPSAASEIASPPAVEGKLPPSHDPRPRIESYAARWPQILHNNATKIELIAEEFRIRHRWGDRPTVAEYFERFGESSQLRGALVEIDRELKSDRVVRDADSTPLSEIGATISDLEFGGHAPPQQNQFGRYRILKRLGQGGMGEVYLADDTQLERRVALKTPHLIKGASLRERFFNEAKAAATLRHPRICQIYDAGEIHDTPFITMEFIDGETLCELWQRGNKSSLAETVRLLAQVASAVHFAHERSIVHRDLKPSNIMIDSSGNAIVMDFGLAHRESSLQGDRLTHSGDFFGTPGYMSPEQVEGNTHEVGPGTDVYSLGVMLYEGITGRRPFRGNSAGAVMAQTLRDTPPPPESTECIVPADLQRLCMRMLEKQASDRPQSMREVAYELDRIARQCGAPAVASAAPTATLPRFGIPIRALTVCLMLFAFGAFAWALVIRIETKDGEVVITSYDPELEVIVRRNGNPVDDFTFDRGAVATKIQTGDIEIEIKGGTPDGVEIRNGTFSLTEGEKVLVEILESENAATSRIADTQAESAFDDFSRSDISAHELKLAGGGDPARAPQELVAVVGDSRLSHYFNSATDVKFNPNGKVVASVGEDSSLRLWSTANGELLDSFNVGGRALSVAYSPDGGRLAVGVANDDGEFDNVQVWNPHSRERILSFTTEGNDAHALLWTPDGKRLIGMVRRNSLQVVVWDAATGREVIALEEEFPGMIIAIALSPDGTRLATGSGGGEALPPRLRLWDADSGEFISEIELGEERGYMPGLAWSPDGKQIAVGLNGPIQKLLVCEIDTKEVVRAVPVTDASAKVVWSSDGKWLASGNREIVLWDAETGRQAGMLESQRLIAPVTQLAFSINGNQLAAATMTGAVILWDVASGKEVVPINGHSSRVTGIDVSSDGKWIASSSLDRTIRVWDTESPAEAGVLKGDYTWFNDVAFSPDGSRLAAAGIHDSLIVVWNALTHEKVFVLSSDSREISDSLGWSPNGNLLAFASSFPYQVKVIDSATGRVRYEKDVLGNASVAFDPSNGRLAVGDHEKVEILEASNGENLYTIEVPAPVRSIAFNPDGTRLLVAGDFPNPMILDAGTGTQVRVFMTDREETFVAAVYSPDGSRIATLDTARRLAYWDASTGKRLQRIQLFEEPNHPGPTIYNQIAFAPDGRHVVVGNDNGTLYVLRLKELQR